MHLDDQLGPELAMVVMGFIQGEDLDWAELDLSSQAFNHIDQAVKLLHSHDFVFGDLREPNVMVLHDSIGRESWRAMLVDFDWCGKDGEGRYLLDINLNTTVKWHEDVGPGAEMKEEHDK